MDKKESLIDLLKRYALLLTSKHGKCKTFE
jgi:hypothetical protein